jgi:broad specificity phosphatase PhoE
MLGRADPPLSQLGEQQARQLAEQLPAPDLVISSPLRRAFDTAAAFGHEVEVDERWIELDYGEFDGLHPDSLPAATWQQWRDDPSFAPPGHSTVLVVTHVSPIKAALAWALDVPISVSWRLFVEDASVCRIDSKDGEKVVRWFNRGLTRAD